GQTNLDGRLDAIEAKEASDYLDLNTKTTTNASNIASTNSRLDGIIANAGNGTVPTELIDVRTGSDGINYATAGDAVRKQFNTINEAVGHAINTLPSSKKDGYYLNLSGGEVAHSSSFVTDYIEINSGMTVKVENVYLDASRSIVAYDKEKNPIEPILYGSTLTTLSFEVKEGWHYFRATGAIARGDIKAYYTGITQDILDATNNLKFQNKTLSNFEGSKLLTGDDLNNLTFGAYHSSSDTVTKALLNAPKGIRGSLKIIYIPIHDNKGIMYLVDAYSKTYVRQFNGNYWTDWEKFGNGISDPYNRTNIDRTELAPLIESFTPTLATWNATEFRWELDTGGRISADITVEANTPYLITVGYTKGTNQMGTWDNGTLFDVVLGDEKISIYALNDANWQVMLTPKTSGTAKLVLGSDLWKGFIYSCKVNKVNAFAIPNFSFSEADVKAYDTSIGIGMFTQQKLAYDASSDNQGKRNTALGMRTHENLDTGYDNTAVGYQAQMNMTNGLGNTAVGNKVQRNVTTGVYNTGVGWNAQANITTGNWNTALGLEAQLALTTGVNNVSVGRRSSDIMTTGSHNVHIGAHSGFYPKATIDSEGQVFVGQQTSQLTDGRQDRAIAIGQFAHADQDAIAIGAGVDAQANRIVIGSNKHESVKIAGKIINFNSDGTVTWS
ncbi:hypothetical protein, partial [Streptococcus parauberis]|uniref:hypothetical protein n=1 Tax=Streptococcus parauberis TaxID=1348 RepID=UPI000B1A3A05